METKICSCNTQTSDLAYQLNKLGIPCCERCYKHG